SIRRAGSAMASGVYAFGEAGSLSAVIAPADSPVPRRQDLRNVAIIAHVDHGKTTLVDALLKQSHVFAAHEQVGELIMDSNVLEREKGITILAKNTSIRYHGVKINIIDTPGHADFGGEVERVLDALLTYIPAPPGDAEGPLQLLVSNLDHDNHIGRLAIGRITRGTLRPGQDVVRIGEAGIGARQRITTLLTVEALQRRPAESASAGEIVYIAGLPDIAVGDTVADAEQPQALPRLEVSEPTLRMQFSVNQSPFAGREATTSSTSRQL